jgi:hypothetical protein
VTDAAKGAIAEQLDTDPIEWADAFLVEAHKDRAECEYVMTHQHEYWPRDINHAEAKLARLTDPDGVVAMVTALVEPLRAVTDWARSEVRVVSKFNEGYDTARSYVTDLLRNRGVGS